MITNLPERLQFDNLGALDFGRSDAQADDLLSYCHVTTSSIQEFLRSKKDIVYGFRGSGKTALVKLLVEKRLLFSDSPGHESVLLCLDEEFDYRAIREFLDERADSEKSRALSCRIVWELLVVYRSLQRVREHFRDDDSDILDCVAEIEAMLGVAERKPRFLEVILSHKKKVGIKLDTNLPSLVDLYTSLEPSLESMDDSTEVGTLRLSEMKRKLNAYLARKSAVLYVLFDRLDDFVVSEDHRTQKLLLQGLLAAQADTHQRCSCIRLKVFIRTDLFRSLNLGELGPDKVIARSVELKWSPSEIRNLLGTRVARFLMQGIGLDTLEIRVDENQFWLQKDELSQIEDAKLSLGRFLPFSAAIWPKLLGLLWFGRASRSRMSEGRRNSARDVVNEILIKTVFAPEVEVMGLEGGTSRLELLAFLDQYLAFAHGQTTPRLVLRFANHCLSAAREYFDENYDLREIGREADGTYPLFTGRSVAAAYQRLRVEAWEIQFQWANEWRELVEAIRQRSRVGQATVSSRELLESTGAEVERLRTFLSFVCQTGLLCCRNEHSRVEEREFDIPELFQSQ